MKIAVSRSFKEVSVEKMRFELDLERKDSYVGMGGTMGCRGRTFQKRGKGYKQKRRGYVY